MEQYTIGVDLGGTTITAGLVDHCAEYFLGCARTADIAEANE